MTAASSSELLKSMAEKLLLPEPDFLTMKQAVEGMYEMFKAITGISCENMNDQDIMLPKGKAISPVAAAHCLLEMKRTTVFLRGIKCAIDSKLQANRRVEILYAGCGPYATLVTPLLSFYTSEQVRVTLLDINPVSIKAAETLIVSLGFEGYVADYILADASTYQVDKPYDIVISETMQSGLKKEPQVAIMQNLIPQCNANTIFIPERITIDAYLKKRGIWQEDQLIEEGGKTTHICELFSVSKTRLEAASYRKIVDMPQSLIGPYDLLLYTTIKVFGEEVLSLNDCSLNLPLRYYEFRDGYPKSIEFWYRQTSKPKIESKVLDYTTNY
ncbi:MAG TPA: hypothetical protein VMW01_16380 [Williamwhitmania sp.]|nr:hypothetical protein [Williamwhitmania sp.]